MKVTLQGALVAPDVHAEGNSTNGNERRALICYQGEFESINGPVTVSPEQLQRVADVHNARMARLGQAIRMADCPPVQLDHSPSARDTVGRVVGPLELGEFEGRMALFGTIRILGLENLEKVNDGRWTHLSIGADLDSGDLLEVTITPFPAAKNAAMLARLGGKMNYEQMKKYLMDTEGISDDEAKTRLESMDEDAQKQLCDKMKAKLSEDENEDKTEMAGDENEDKEELGDSVITIEHDADGDGQVNMSDEENEDKTEMSEDEDKDKTEMSEDEDDDKDELSEDEDDKDKAELSAKLAGFRKRTSSLRVRMAKAHIGNVLTQLRAKGKITPAEIRKMDLDKLSTENEATVKAILKTYEDRQPVIMAGQYGSIEAIDRERLQAEAAHHQLKKEVLSHMPFTAKAHGYKMAATNDQNTVSTGNTMPVDANTQMGDAEGMWNEIVRAIGEGRHDDAKSAFVRACRMGSGDVSATPEDMAELMAAVQDLESDFGAVVQLAGAKLGIQL